MTEDNRQKEIRLKKELAQLKASNSAENRAVKKNRDFSVGLPEDTSKKPLPTSSDIPDVVSLPPKRRGKTENIPY
jgi:hypothetical protein